MEIVPIWQLFKCLYIEEWINKLIYSFDGKYKPIRTNTFITTCNIWLNLKNIMLSERIQTQKNCIAYETT